MMRLMVLLAVALGAVLYFPSSRELILARSEPILRPAYRWTTERELRGVAETLALHVANRDDERFLRRYLDAWLDSEYPALPARMDSWGTRYALEVDRSRIRIVSAGPDLLFGPADDLSWEEPRN